MSEHLVTSKEHIFSNSFLSRIGKLDLQREAVYARSYKEDTTAVLGLCYDAEIVDYEKKI